MIVYMAVTADRYELPLAVADTAGMLGKFLNCLRKNRCLATGEEKPDGLFLLSKQQFKKEKMIKKRCMHCKHHYPLSDSNNWIHMMCVNAKSDHLLKETGFMDSCKSFEEEDLEDEEE